MKVVAINGSPKAKGQSMSGRIIGQMEKILGEGIKTYQAIRLVRTETPTEVLENILSADVLLIVHPLYVDSLPAPLIELLTRLENASRDRIIKPWVFAIVHCGYFEPQHTTLALKMAEHFASRAGLTWGYGLGVGGGPMLSSSGDNWEKGPAVTVYNALRDMAATIREKKTGQNIFVAPKCPRFLYKAIANFGWRYEAGRNKAPKLRARPYTEHGGSPL